MLPSVALLLSRHGIDASFIKATGPKGNILKGDVLLFLASGGRSPLSKPVRFRSADLNTEPLIAITRHVSPSSPSSNIENLFQRAAKRASKRVEKLSVGPKITFNSNGGVHSGISVSIDQPRLGTVIVNRKVVEAPLKKSILDDLLNGPASIQFVETRPAMVTRVEMNIAGPLKDEEKEMLKAWWQCFCAEVESPARLLEA